MPAEDGEYTSSGLLSTTKPPRAAISYHPRMDLASAASRGAGTIHQAFEEHHQYLSAITRRVARRFEERDW